MKLAVLKNELQEIKNAETFDKTAFDAKWNEINAYKQNVKTYTWYNSYGNPTTLLIDDNDSTYILGDGYLLKGIFKNEFVDRKKELTRLKEHYVMMEYTEMQYDEMGQHLYNN